MHTYISIRLNLISSKLVIPKSSRGRRGRMVVGFTTTCAISAYHY